MKTTEEELGTRLVQYWKDKASNAVAEYASWSILRKFWRTAYETSVVEIKRISRKGGFSEEDLRNLEDYASRARTGLVGVRTLTDKCKKLRAERDFCKMKLKEAKKAEVSK